MKMLSWLQEFRVVTKSLWRLMTFLLISSFFESMELRYALMSLRVYLNRLLLACLLYWKGFTLLSRTLPAWDCLRLEGVWLLISSEPIPIERWWSGLLKERVFSSASLRLPLWCMIVTSYSVYLSCCFRRAICSWLEAVDYSN